MRAQLSIKIFNDDNELIAEAFNKVDDFIGNDERDHKALREDAYNLVDSVFYALLFYRKYKRVPASAKEFYKFIFEEDNSFMGAGTLTIGFNPDGTTQIVKDRRHEDTNSTNREEGSNNTNSTNTSCGESGSGNA